MKGLGLLRLIIVFMLCIQQYVFASDSPKSLNIMDLQQAGEKQPLKAFNRAMFGLNEVTDKYFVKPTAVFYKNKVPLIARKGVSNFFTNIDHIPTTVNSLLQGKVKHAGFATSRFLINSTLGLFGIFDVADKIGLKNSKYQREDFGQTLGYWGVPSGPYIILPFLGPSNLRDTVGTIADWNLDITNHFEDQHQVASRVLYVTDLRSDLLVADSVSMQNKYLFFKTGYEQRRNYMIGRKLFNFDRKEKEDDDEWDDEF